MRIAFAEPSRPKSGTIVVGVLEDRKLTPTAAALDKETGGALKRAIEASRFTGRKDEVLGVLAPSRLSVGRVLLVGLGKAQALDAATAQALGGTVVAQLNSVGESEAAVALDHVPGMKLAPEDAAANLAFGAELRSYRFDRYRTKEKPEQKPTLKTLSIMTDAAGAARRAFAPLKEVAEGVFLTRDLISEPANVIYPETLAAAARQLTKVGVDVEVLDERQMKRLGMGALLGVGQGSVRPPRLVVMQWKGGRRGKGAGVVIGLMRALAGRKAKVNAVGVIGLVENMPSGSAQRPGDIVHSMSGQTIEVLNTDAEGRLVLADALWYCQDRFKPKFMVNLATLTGAIIIALGSEHAGLFSNNDELAGRLAEAGMAVGEKVWRLPLADGYDRMMDSDAADIKNISGG